MKLALVRGSMRFLVAQAFFSQALYPRQKISNCVTLELAGDADVQLDADLRTLRDIVTGFNRLEDQFAEPGLNLAAKSRGYFTPDEDDRLRQMLLAYRSYRLRLYEILQRYLGYRRIADPARQLQGFMVGFGAALTLYAKSLRLIQTCEREAQMRKKLNEPDTKFGLEAGFFDEVLGAFSSLSNYRLLVQANWFWRTQRHLIQKLELVAAPDWGWLADLIRRQRVVVRQRLLQVLGCRLRHDWRMFWKTTVQPVRSTRYCLQAFVGGTVAGVRTTAHYQPAITETLLSEIHSELKPGDVLLVRAEQKLTSAVLPSFWAHAALYFGGREDLLKLGLRTHPHVSGRWESLPQERCRFGCVIEAINPRTTISPLEKSLYADHVAVLRPNIPADKIAGALAEAFGHLGKPYDYEFDFSVSSRIVCTELIYRCYHHRGTLEFPLVKRLGRYTLSGDDIALLALHPMSPGDDVRLALFRLVRLALKGPTGEASFIPEIDALETLRRIHSGWRPAKVKAA